MLWRAKSAVGQGRRERSYACHMGATEDVYKVYAESLDGEERLERILDEAREIVGRALGG